MTLNQIIRALAAEGYVPADHGGDNRTKSLSFMRFEGPEGYRFIVKEEGFWAFCDAEKFAQKRDKFARRKGSVEDGIGASGSFEKLFMKAASSGMKVGLMKLGKADESGEKELLFLKLKAPDGRNWRLERSKNGNRKGGEGAWKLVPVEAG